MSDQMLVAPSDALDLDRAARSAPHPRTGTGPDHDTTALDMLTRLARETLDAEALGDGSGEPARVAVLSSVEAQVVAQMLDLLSGLYPGELLAQLAGSLSVRLWERLEV